MSSSKTSTAGSPGVTPWIGLFTLAGAVFVSVTSELLPTGLLPQMAEGLGVSQSSIGILVAIFAATVVVSAVALTGLTRRLPRKPLVLAVLAVFAASNLLIAVAPSYEVVVVARVLGGAAQGLFWAVVGAYPGHLLPKEKLARGVAITSAGGSAAFILGVPAGTAMGLLVGWRLAFAIVGGVVVLLGLIAWRFLPAVQHRGDLAGGAERVAAPRVRWYQGASFGVIVLVCVTVFTLMSGHNLFYTFIVPFFTDVNGFAVASVSALLLLHGAAGIVGLVLVATVGARFPRSSLATSIAFVSLSVLIIGVHPSAHLVVLVSLFAWGVALSLPPALLQTRLLHTVSPEVRDVAAALMTTGFNLGIAAGALVGSGLRDTAGLGVLPLAGAAVSAVCFVLVMIGDRLLRSRS